MKVLQCPRSPQCRRVTNFPFTFMARGAMDLSRATATTRRRTLDSSPPPLKGTSTLEKHWEQPAPPQGRP